MFWLTKIECDGFESLYASSATQLTRIRPVRRVQVHLEPSAAVASMLALYHGEEWLESNCW